MATSLKNKFFEEGRAAAYAGKTLQDNPYTLGSIAWGAWMRGWNWVKGRAA